jgi:hypothetical protein
MPEMSVTATREMPQFAQPPARGERRSPPSRTAATGSARAGGKSSAKTPARIGAAARAAGTAPAGSSGAGRAPRDERDEARDHVIADAVRLLRWGRKWFELADLIARMADRPPLPEVRRILKDNKTAIDKKAGRG